LAWCPTGSSAAVLYTRSLHDALPISGGGRHGRVAPAARSRPSTDTHHAVDGDVDDPGVRAAASRGGRPARAEYAAAPARQTGREDRKSTRLNSSHVKISYAVLCLKKK